MILSVFYPASGVPTVMPRNKIGSSSRIEIIVEHILPAQARFTQGEGGSIWVHCGFKGFFPSLRPSSPTEIIHRCGERAYQKQSSPVDFLIRLIRWQKGKQLMSIGVAAGVGKLAVATRWWLHSRYKLYVTRITAREPLRSLSLRRAPCTARA